MTTFRNQVLAAKAQSPDKQIRYLAFVTDNPTKAFTGNRYENKSAFLAWIADRKAEYAAAYPGWLLGGVSIASQEHFTDFILRGGWRND